MPIKAILKSFPVTLMIVGCVIFSVMAVALRSVVIHMAGPPDYEFALTASEIMAVVFGIIAAGMAYPTMADVDLFRPRAGVLAVSRTLSAFVLTAVCATSASLAVIADYRADAGPLTDSYPGVELIIHNALLVSAVTCILVCLFGRSVGLPVALILWWCGYIPAIVNPMGNLWPLDFVHGPGPWFSLPHVATSAAVMLLALFLNYRYGGASPLSRSRHE